MHRFVRGERFWFRNHEWEIRANVNGNVVAENLTYGREEEFPERDLVRALSSGELRFRGRGTQSDGAADQVQPFPVEVLEDAPEEDLQVLNTRLLVVQRLLATERTTAAYERALAELAEKEGIRVTLRTARRWIRAYLDAQRDPRALLPKSKNAPRRTDPRLLEMLHREIENYYLTRERPSARQLMRRVLHEAQEHNRVVDPQDAIPLPRTNREHDAFYRLVCREIETVPHLRRIQERHGRRAAQAELAGLELAEKPTRILERVEIDHTRFDLMVVDPATRVTIGRPTLTLVIDVFSHYPLGFYLGWEPPSVLCVMYALRHAILPKDYVVERYPEVKNRWLAEGLPETIVVDNAWEHQSRALRTACEQLGIRLTFSPPRKPWYRGTVERTFRTINQLLLAHIPGRTFSNPRERGEYQPEKVAVISPEALEKILHICLIDIYAQKWHRGAGGIPARIWEKSAGEHPAPRWFGDISQLHALLARTEERKILRSGIYYRNIQYNSLRLQSIRHALLRHTADDNPTVRFRFDPADLGHIWVLDPATNHYVEVPALNQAYARGLSLFKHEVILKQRRELQEEVDHDGLVDAQARIEAVVKQEARATAAAKRRLARRQTGGKPFSEAYRSPGTPERRTPERRREAAKSPTEQPRLKPVREAGRPTPIVSITFDPTADEDLSSWGVVDLSREVSARG